MNRKNKYITLAALALSFCVSSCDNYLDTLPDNRMEIKDADQVSKLLVSAYSQANPAYLLEMYSDNSDEIINTGWTSAGQFQQQAYDWDDITDVSENESPQQLWNSYYTATSSANQALQYIEQHPDENLSAQKGEALLCRAYNAFMLANVFCMAYDETTASTALGLPYPTEPETKVGTTYQRGTLAELYSKIDADIQQGIKLVNDNYSQPKFHFTKNAAYAFAARFYLYYHKYDKAEAYATKVIGNNPASRLRDWAALNKLSTNDYIQPQEYVNSSLNCNLLLQVAYSSWGAINGPYLYGDRYAHGALISSTETLQADGPWGNSSQMNYSVWHNSSLSKYMLRKLCYSFEYTDIQTGSGYPHGEYSVFNTDETLLVRAEARALQHNYEGALDDINAELSKFHSASPKLTIDGIRNFYSGINYYTPTEPTPKKQFHTSFAIEEDTEEPMLQCILQLRRLVTMHEGLRMQDVKRYGIVIYRRQVDASQNVLQVTDEMRTNDPRRAVQLPQDVINAGLKPNPRTL